MGNEEVWVTKDGKSLSFEEIDDKHLDNIIAYIRRNAEEGLQFFHGGSDIYGTFGGVELLEGQDVLDLFNYNLFIEERDRRRQEQCHIFYPIK